MNLVQLHAEINKHFPKIWIKEGGQFSNAHRESLWTGEGSMIEFKDELEGFVVPVDAFDMYPMFPEMYEFGVYKEFAEFLRERGYHAEAHDAGTFFIWKS